MKQKMDQTDGESLEELVSNLESELEDGDFKLDDVEFKLEELSEKVDELEGELAVADSLIDDLESEDR
jgi:peptidoglycan hydrolase CwlO-like protein